MAETRFERIEALDTRYTMHTYARLKVAFVKGSRSRLWDTSGKEYIDLISGLGVTILGHAHPEVTRAISEQAAALMHTTNLYYIEPQAELARMLVENSFEGKVFFCNSGAEANEGALKLARRHHFNKGSLRSKVVCAMNSFHGRTIATLGATGNPGKWIPFSPMLPGFTHVPLNSEEKLEAAIDSETAAVLLEPIQGEGGVFPADDTFLEAARAACDRTGALLVFDEVQTGMGRTGDLFAWQKSGVRPDVMTVAKGLANGVPVGAFIGAGGIGDELQPGDHGSTFGGNFLACAAGVATMGVVLREDLPARAGSLGAVAVSRLEDMVDRLPLATQVRGRGLMLALQLAEEKASQLAAECMNRGVLVNVVMPDAIRLLPALNIPEEDLQRGLDVIEKSIEEVS